MGRSPVSIRFRRAATSRVPSEGADVVTGVVISVLLVVLRPSAGRCAAHTKAARRGAAVVSSCWVPPRSGQPPARARRAYGRHGRAGGGHEPQSIGSAPRPRLTVDRCLLPRRRSPTRDPSCGERSGRTSGVPGGSLTTTRTSAAATAGRGTTVPSTRRSRCRTPRSRRCPGSTTRPCTPSSGTAASSGSTRSARAGGCCCTSGRSTTGPRSGSTGSWSPATRAGTPRSTLTSPTRSARVASRSSWCAPRIRPTTPPSRAASRTGDPRRTTSGTTGRPASGSRCGGRWSATGT